MVKMLFELNNSFHNSKAEIIHVFNIIKIYRKSLFEKKMTISRYALLAAATATIGEVNAYWGIGWCPIFAPDPVGDFLPERYAGNWYEIKKDKDVWY